jgi:hypothetical protein
MVGRGSRTVDRYSQGTDRLPRHRLQVQIARRAGPSAVQASDPIVIVDSFSLLGTSCTSGSAVFRPSPNKGPSPPGAL